DGILTAYNCVVDTAINLTSTTINVIGSLSCMLGGTTFALSYVFNAELSGSYFGKATVGGDLVVGISLKDMNVQINGSLPFNYLLQNTGEISYSSKDYLEPADLRTASAIFIFSGTAVKLLSANLKIWQKNRLDERYLRDNQFAECLKSPQLDEYLLSNAESLCSALTCTLLSCSVTGLIFCYSPIADAKKRLTYPANGVETPFANGDYNGPVLSDVFPVTFLVEKNITIPFRKFHFDLAVNEQVSAKALANMTYGGGLFFKLKPDSNFPIILPAVIGSGAHLLGSFFNKKRNNKRDERIAHAREARFSLSDINEYY
ncbi:MAG: hypothetical protein PSV35_07410, partial [bacterium]|nr:hypothetical protein [bacterium]